MINRPLGIYIHYPFCLALCPYCDFNSFVKDNTSEDKILQAYLSELEYYKQKCQNVYVKSIYFGGGTPSLMNPQTVKTVIDFIKQNFVCELDLEITLEANPTSIENQKLKDFKQAGINRVSIGVQALNDYDLKFLGRKHSSKEAIKAIEIASSIFDEFTFDLIYARHKNHSLIDWKNELKQAISLAGNHLSLYSLTIEKGTDFFTQNTKGLLSVPNPEQAEKMYFETLDIMEQNGFKRYEISNYAKNGKISQHNMLYWQIHDYIGIGPGAHGRIFYGKTRMQTMTQHKPQKWLQVVDKNIGLQIEKPITKNEQIIEILMMGLRITEGINLDDIKCRLGINLLQSIVNLDKTEGFIIIENNFLKPTKNGINIANSLAKMCYCE